MEWLKKLSWRKALGSISFLVTTYESGPCTVLQLEVSVTIVAVILQEFFHFVFKDIFILPIQPYPDHFSEFK